MCSVDAQLSPSKNQTPWKSEDVASSPPITFQPPQILCDYVSSQLLLVIHLQKTSTHKQSTVTVILLWMCNVKKQFPKKIKTMGTEDISFLITERITLLQKFSCISCIIAYTLAGWIVQKILISCRETWISFSRFKDSQAVCFSFHTYFFCVLGRSAIKSPSLKPRAVLSSDKSEIYMSNEKKLMMTKLFRSFIIK